MRSLVTLMVLVPLISLAQAPLKIGYQGRLLKADGTPAQGSLSVRFELFANASGGTALWSETQTLVLTDGLYSTFLGEVSPLQAALFDGSERFLELTIGTTALTPRQRVASVPYALAARDPRLLDSCTDGQVMQWNSTMLAWACATVGGGGGNFVTQPQLTTTLADYVTATALTSSLNGYTTNAALMTALNNYATTASLNNYVSSAALNTTLNNYALSSAIPTSVNGLTGGAINGTVAATLFTQNGNTVCDTSGNCGATLGSFSPSSCTANQVISWTGTGFQCTTPSTGTPTQACSGANRALQWDGTAWQCVNLATTTIAGGRANGFEARDDWGDTWDGISRPARSWTEAKTNCESVGARLPTVTELWRNRASYGTGNISPVNDTTLLWTISISYRAGFHVIQSLANNSLNENADTASVAYRCIWKAAQPTGFSGNRCYGRPGQECQSRDAIANIDRLSRAPQYLPSAVSECALEGAELATVEDLSDAILGGADFVSQPDTGWPLWHFASSASASNSGIGYQRLLRWTTNPEPGWLVDASSAAYAGPASPYSFRCVGKKSPTAGVLPTASCAGGCTTVTRGTRFLADSADRPAQNWVNATETCRALGGLLPTSEDYLNLITSGAPGGSGSYLWSATPSLSSGSWLVVRWSGVGSPLWNVNNEYSAVSPGQRSTMAAPASVYPFRCVWPETQAATFPTCAANEVVMRNATTGAFSCVASVNGNAQGNSNPPSFPPFVDAWGNAFDLFERPAVTLANAKTTCESLGGRLPLATELYRVRFAQGVVASELGQPGTATQNYLWVLNPPTGTNATTLRLSDGLAASSAVAAALPFRCVWPSSKPDAFSGNACYGTPASPCFETGRLRTDQYARAPIPFAQAQWECRYLGGRVVSVREHALLQHASLPNNTTVEISRDWANWNGTTYTLLPQRGANPVRTEWAYDGARGEQNVSSALNANRFRCVFTDTFE